MLPTLILAMLALLSPQAGSAQGLIVLHIKVALVDAEQKTTPVPRHVLLISDNPSSAPPRRVMTGSDGTVDVGLRPGNYTVESDRPIAFNGVAYSWTRTVDVIAGREAVIDLTAANAEVESVTSAAAASASAAPLEADPSFLLPRWADSVVALWTPKSHASGFVIDANGLIATNQRVVGAATSVEVQLSPTVKIAARVLAADPLRNVAILWIDPKAAASLKPLPLGCGQAARPAVADREELFTIGAPLREQKGMASGTVSRVEPHSIDADFRLASGSEGGPVFTAGGGLIGITSEVDGGEDGPHRPGIATTGRGNVG
ncbi:MAG: serine protease, partial [Acidobacteriota bacterium]